MGVGVGLVLVQGLGLELVGMRVGVASVLVLVRGLGLLAVEVRVGAVGGFVMVLEWVQELVPAGLVRGWRVGRRAWRGCLCWSGHWSWRRCWYRYGGKWRAGRRM